MLVVTSDHSEVQEPRYADPERRSFPIGQVDAEVQDKIPLESVKPRVIRPHFADAKRHKDVLELGDKLSELFRSQMNDGVLVFSDVTEVAEKSLACKCAASMFAESLISSVWRLTSIEIVSLFRLTAGDSTEAP